jgi:hypothetical protein
MRVHSLLLPGLLAGMGQVGLAQIEELIDLDTKVGGVILTGGFANSEYLLNCLPAESQPMLKLSGPRTPPLQLHWAGCGSFQPLDNILNGGTEYLTDIDICQVYKTGLNAERLDV